MKGKKRTGRKGLDLWHILVLGVVRMSLGTNYDRLLDLSNNHMLIRQVMGIRPVCEEGKEFAYTTIHDNVILLNEQTLEKINTIVVKAGHQILKKKEEKLAIKADTYVLEANVHFPSDISLLLDSARKCFDIIEDLGENYQIKGWRKTKVLERRVEETKSHSVKSLPERREK